MRRRPRGNDTCWHWLPVALVLVLSCDVARCQEGSIRQPSNDATADPIEAFDASVPFDPFGDASGTMGPLSIAPEPPLDPPSTPSTPHHRSVPTLPLHPNTSTNNHSPVSSEGALASQQAAGVQSHRPPPAVPASPQTHTAPETQRTQPASPPQEFAAQDACPPSSSWTLDAWVSPERFKSSASTFTFVAIVSLAPAALLMTTSFVRLSIVFSLLRQAIGVQILPSNQVLTTLAMFLTVCIMWPTWSRVYDEAVVPYTDTTEGIPAQQAWERGIGPIREFMSAQIELAGNSENVVLFYETLPEFETAPESYDDVPLRILLPAYLLSELKVAFLLGFQIYLPFLVIDVFVSAVTTSMGMMMLPPLSISLPLKLIVFVLVDGWTLLAGTLMSSFLMPGT